jgi:hypothetical protein
MSVAAQRIVVSDSRAPRRRLDRRQLLLACGFAFSLSWIGLDVVASMSYDGYSYTEQTVSELSAIGAPTRPLWVAFSPVWNLLAVAFAIGIWQSAGTRRALRVVAGLLIANAIVNLVLGPFSSMHTREALAAEGATLSDTLHLVVTGAGVFTFLVEIGCGAALFGRWFRLYSIATILAMLLFGAITSWYAPAVQADGPTPWVGVYERINAYGYMLWIMVLAVKLWPAPFPDNTRRLSP